jgi:cyclase
VLTKRIIPCLDIKNGRTVKGTNFVQLRDAGDPVELAKQYSQSGADELVFLDISATLEKRKTLAELVKQVAKEINIPFTVGGGISSVADVGLLLQNGADKVSVNSAAVKRPELVAELAREFGSQCVVVAIDSREVNGADVVHVKGGTEPTPLETFAWAKQVEDMGAGEILLTSMDHDGTKQGFATRLTGKLNQSLGIPVIASGGAGNAQHFEEVFSGNHADAALAASIFHFQEVGIQSLKQQLQSAGIRVRL